jgi:hypothetical protein
MSFSCSFERWSFIFWELISVPKISSSIFLLNWIEPYSRIWRCLSYPLIIVRLESLSFRNWRKAWSLLLIGHSSTRWGVISSISPHIRASWHFTTLHISHWSRHLSMWVHPRSLILIIVRLVGASRVPPRVNSLLVNFVLETLAHHRFLTKWCRSFLLHIRNILCLLCIITNNIAIQPQLISIVVSKYFVLLGLVYTGPHHLELPYYFHSFSDVQW